jgi:ABC-type antimicrobial peptide transport system permease subunit
MAGNARRFTAVGITGSILSFLGKGVITMSSVFLTVVIINEAFTDQVKQPAIPAVIVALFAYMISSVFLSVYDFSALTILHCFCLDES